MKNGKEGVVREIMMGSPVTLKPEDTLDLANDVISLGRIRHIPVVEDGRLIGLLSERDMLGAAATTIFGLKQKSKSALLKTFFNQGRDEKEGGHGHAGDADQGCRSSNEGEKDRLCPGGQCGGPGGSCDHHRYP
jgi:CBS domain